LEWAISISIEVSMPTYLLSIFEDSITY